MLISRIRLWMQMAILAGVSLVLAGIVGGGGRAQLPGQAPPGNERNLMQAVDGAALFRAYCATCHGKDATGGGPSAVALRKKVPDLTRIAQRHNGAFPLDEVRLTISGEVVPSPAHGSREMPIWGPVFSQVEWDQDLGRVRIHNLAKYLESLQKK